MTLFNSGPKSLAARAQQIIVPLTGILLFAALVQWGGRPSDAALPYFIAGVALFLGVLATFVFLTWRLLFRALPAGHKVSARSALDVRVRQLLAVLVGIAGINIVIGGYWDEVWHRQFGIPFGEDLLWRPHLLLYTGFFIVSLLAFAGLAYMLRNGKGTLSQRFRADPIVGLLVLVGAFLLFALPADPLWHLIYGEDISAWSLPHLILVLSFALIMLLAVAIQASTILQRSWASMRRIDARGWYVLVLLAFMLLVTMQVMVTEWDASSLRIVQSRPEWLLPAVLAAVAVFTAAVANHSTRAWGAASAVGLIAIGVRLALVTSFGNNQTTVDPWLATLPVMVAFDLLYALYIRRYGRPPAWALAGCAATVGLALASFPLINQLFDYPTIDLRNLLPMTLAGLGAALGASWAGARLGNFLGTANKQSGEDGKISLQLRIVPALSLAVVMVFIIVFILTATTPA